MDNVRAGERDTSVEIVLSPATPLRPLGRHYEVTLNGLIDDLGRGVEARVFVSLQATLLDEIIVFDRLGRADMGGIVEIQMARLLKRLAGRNIRLELDEGAKKWLADEGYDPVFGARPLKRVIQKALQDPLAEALLAGDVKDGDTVPVSAGSDGLLIGNRVGSTGRGKPDQATVH